MIKINKAGYLYIVLTILIGLSAVNTANNLVYIVTSGLLSYMLVSGLFGRKNIRDLRMLPEFPDELFAGIDVPVLVRLVNPRKHMPAFLVTVTVDGRDVFFPFVGPGGSACQVIGLRFERRGVHTFGDYTISSFYPFNFFTRYRTVRSKARAMVYPRPVKCAANRVCDRFSRALGERSSDAAGSDSDLISIRDYAPGDQPKRIDWKSTAKTGVLKTRELSTTELEHVIVDFDRMDKRDLEYALSCVTHVVLRMFRSGTPVGMTIGGETCKPGNSAAHKGLLLKKLALYGQNQDPA